ncbi:hypothetical protein QYE76_021180 [Lolium multiflorum]|uniref:Uncharacterized protein n=1 Tax=Lolium multiflorum TaxID=4521 RepID=A0AAD8VSV9_LOLMU|nr:hypothetical protein QYE76_021180 [Lolium multiflorum]
MRVSHANRTHMALAHHADAIKMLAKDRKYTPPGTPRGRMPRQQVCGRNQGLWVGVKEERLMEECSGATPGTGANVELHNTVNILCPNVTRAKKDATIARLRANIVSLETTVKAQEDQLKEMEEEGDDIQGGEDFLSDDDDFEEDEFTDEEDYEFLEAAEDGINLIDVDEDDEE